ncbi:MAG: DnaB-like helicase C-terminal domain-containing protein [Tannerellaceae bacterium]
MFSIRDWKGKEVIGFVFSHNGIEHNVKFRTLEEKSFFFANKGAITLPFNGDVIGSSSSLVITEGEPDALAYATVGIRYVISVPTGAGVRRVDWLRPFEAVLEDIDTFYIAVDDDPRGHELREVLVEYLGADRCRIVEFDGCKDANEQLLKYGPEAVAKSIRKSMHPGEACVELPFAESNSLILGEGVDDSDIESFDAEYAAMLDLLHNGGIKGDKLDVPEIDELVSWRTGQLAVVTGIPSHGKSEFVDFVVVCLNRLYGYKAVMWSPENYPVTYHRIKHVSKITGRSFNKHKLSNDDLRVALEDLRDEIFYATPDEYRLSLVLEKLERMVVKHKARIVTLDPFNALEYDGDSNLTETERINRVLGRLQLFARKFDVLVILVAHPRKMDILTARGVGKHYQEPMMYDVCGSANFLNRADYGIVVYRSAEGEYVDNTITNFVRITFEKIRFRDLGSGGSCLLRYNYDNGRYESIDSTINDWDYSWWKKYEEEQADEVATDVPDDAPHIQPS